jgi:hypothetical protein
MTIRDIYNCIAGHSERLHRDQRHDYYVMRYQTAMLLRPYMEKGKTIEPRDIIAFADEDIKSEAVEISQADIDAMDRWDLAYTYIPS